MRFKSRNKQYSATDTIFLASRFHNGFIYACPGKLNDLRVRCCVSRSNPFSEYMFFHISVHQRTHFMDSPKRQSWILPKQKKLSCFITKQIKLPKNFQFFLSLYYSAVRFLSGVEINICEKRKKCLHSIQTSVGRISCGKRVPFSLSRRKIWVSGAGPSWAAQEEVKKYCGKCIWTARKNHNFWSQNLNCEPLDPGLWMISKIMWWRWSRVE